MDDLTAKHYLDDALSNFRDYRKLAEKAFGQVGDEEFFLALDEEANSIAVIARHMSGNMRSRWTDFLTTDGEKPDRQRDLEFVTGPQTTREQILAEWEAGWRCVFDALEPLRAEDAMRKVLIRGQEHTVVQAINRQLTHYAYHIGQIVFLAKHFRSADWKSLSIPRNRSAEFNAYLSERNKQPDEGEGASRFQAPLDFVRDAETKT
ncbi:MAG TPA: DUF1572 family protein [Pyrinomonadaceae bacterium]|jgi:hypothetical protein